MLRRLVFSCCLAAAAYGQPVPAFQANPEADLAWQQLIAVIPPIEQPGLHRQLDEPTRAALRADKSERDRKSKPAKNRERYTRAAQLARDFHTRFPSHPQAATARKLEVLSQLAATAPLDDAAERDAIRAATEFRNNSAHPARDRFDVALALERRDQAKTPRRGDGHHEETEDERMVDRLRRDFGDTREVYALYGRIIKHGHMQDAERVAAKVLRLTPPADVAAEARAVVARKGLVGKPVHISFHDTRGDKIDLRTSVGKPTVIVFSAPGASLYRDERGAVNPTRWIHVILGPAGSASPALSTRAGNAVISCVEPTGFASRIAREFKVRATPFAVVLDSAGVLRGYGPADDLTQLLALVGR